MYKPFLFVHMLNGRYCKLLFKKTGYSKLRSEKLDTWDNLSCDDCGDTYSRKTKISEPLKNRWGGDYCKKCLKVRNGNYFGKVGADVLKSFNVEEKRKYASKAGKIAALKYDPEKNKSRFSSERWRSLSPEDQKKQVTRANKALHEKIKVDSEFRERYYKKSIQKF